MLDGCFILYIPPEIGPGTESDSVEMKKIDRMKEAIVWNLDLVVGRLRVVVAHSPRASCARGIGRLFNEVFTSVFISDTRLVCPDPSHPNDVHADVSRVISEMRVTARRENSGYLYALCLDHVPTIRILLEQILGEDFPRCDKIIRYGPNTCLMIGDKYGSVACYHAETTSKVVHLFQFPRSFRRSI